MVRDTDFTPTDIRFLVQGALERRPASDADLAPFLLVSDGTGQRFALAPADDGRAALDALSNVRATTVTAWGTVTRQEGRAELILHVEGHSVDAR